MGAEENRGRVHLGTLRTGPQRVRHARVGIPWRRLRPPSALVLALGGAVLACSAAQAQSGDPAPENRIESVFDILPGNPLDLAVQLTRRALARRLSEGESMPAAAPSGAPPPISD